MLTPVVASIPLITDAYGVIRISKTRVTLDIVITAFLGVLEGFYAVILMLILCVFKM